MASDQSASLYIRWRSEGLVHPLHLHLLLVLTMYSLFPFPLSHFLSRFFGNMSISVRLIFPYYG